MDQNEENTTQFMNEKESQCSVGKYLLKKAYEQIRNKEMAK